MGTGGHQTPQILHSLVLKQLLSTKWWRNVFNSKLAELQFIQQQRLQCFVNAGEGRRLPVRTSRSLLPVCLVESHCLQIVFFLGVCLFRVLCQTLFSHLGNHHRPHWHLNFHLRKHFHSKAKSRQESNIRQNPLVQKDD